MTPGDIFVFEFPDVGGYEQAGPRPAVVLQDDGYAGILRTTFVVPLSSQAGTTRFPSVVPITPTPVNGLRMQSFALVFQARVVDRRRVRGRMGRVERSVLDAIHAALDKLLGRAQAQTPSPGNAMIELHEATKTYEQGRRVVNAVRGVSLRVNGGEFVTIMGPSGSGKSTLMHLMGALDTPTSGRAVFQGQDIQAMTDTQRSLLRRTRIGFVFQAFNLLPTLTAAENVALPLLLGGTPRRDAITRAVASLERVGLAHRAEHFPEEMSGGEMQRVAVARALVGDPDAVLCDEPTGNLDSTNSREILTLLAALPEPGRRAVVMVTHDPAAARFGTRLVKIKDGLVESDAPVVAG